MNNMSIFRFFVSVLIVSPLVILEDQLIIGLNVMLGRDAMFGVLFNQILILDTLTLAPCSFLSKFLNYFLKIF